MVETVLCGIVFEPQNALFRCRASPTTLKLFGCMKKIFALVLFLAVGMGIADAQSVGLPDEIIMRRGDTIRCELVLPPPVGNRLFYYVGEGGEYRPMEFVSYDDVLFIHEGTSDRYYYVSTKDEWIELSDKSKMGEQPWLKNRFGVSGGIQMPWKGGVVPVARLEYVRYQWRNFGIGLLADYSRFDGRITTYHIVSDTYTSRDATVNSVFVGPKISQRFFMYNTSSFIHIDLAVGYYSSYRAFMGNDPYLTGLAHVGFVLSLGWELLFSRDKGWALDMGMSIYPDGMGVSLGVKFGK